eukprot:CAMPEP_0177743170 /NCGR_PEP_ID=MMETSP0484_2-20121128/29059_1 /TAXON_ID=354590 /ORGANISM="Rhodomonas lens, Strain RHODO" /LENGTH=35 /DNA_ID= /DNA_START= /DNA_END= /DNA_ORIENTATION=
MNHVTDIMTSHMTCLSPLSHVTATTESRASHHWVT